MDDPYFFNVESVDKVVDRTALEQATTIFLQILNMECQHCGIWLRNSLLALDGVLRVDAFPDRGVVVVTYSPAVVTQQVLLRAVREVGRQVRRYYSAEVLGSQPSAQIFRCS